MKDSDEAFRSFRIRGMKRIILAFLSTASFFIMTNQVMAQIDSGLKFKGDFRLRYENTNNIQFVTSRSDVNNNRHREVVRFRASMTKQMSEYLTFGTRLASGSREDPNTADVTLGQFVDDIQIGLDQAFLSYKKDGLFFTGGKFSNPFMKTDLVWDGDVNPQGVTAGYASTGSGNASAKITGIYSIVDERTLVSDSYMTGGQIQLGVKAGENASLTFAGAYYDYTIKSLSNADAGDTRSNFLNADETGYLSDFDLLDFIVSLEYRGAGEKTPIRFVGDFVKNRGAVNDEDSGIMLDLFVGRASQKKDVRVRYGYSQTDTDAVFAAFSNDNTTIATNYQQHTVTCEYVALENTIFNLTWYIHRRNKVPEGVDNEFISRLRLNAVVKF